MCPSSRVPHRFFSLRWKLSVLIVAVVVGMGLFSLYFLSVLNNALLDEHHAKGLSIARNLAANSVEPILIDNPVRLTSLLAASKEGNGEIAYAFVTDSPGKVIAHSFLTAFPKDLARAVAAPKRSPDSFLRIDTEEGIVEDIAAPILGGKVGTLHLGYSERIIDEKYTQIRNAFLWITGAFLGSILFASHLIGIRLFARPIEKMTAAVDEFSKGNLAKRIEVSSRDELGTFSRAFNTMADDLQKYLREKEEARELLQKAHDELEDRVRERTVQLAAANQELEAFAYSVSHDLRAPLRGIDGFSLALLEDYGDKLDAEGKDYLQRVRNGCTRMGQLIDDLLQLSRLTRAEMRREPVNLSEMVLGIVEELRGASPGRTVEAAIAPGLRVVADPSLLRAAMVNLLGNAWKFTSKVPAAKIEFGMLTKENRPVYFVRDNGAGFDMHYVQKLFGAFQRLHSGSEFEGTGIGLATVQRIIHRHGGLVWAEGAIDQGATFYFTLEEGEPT